VPSYMTAQQVAEMLQVSERRITDLVKAGVIPKPLMLGPRTRRWRASDFDTHKPRRNVWEEKLSAAYCRGG